MRIGVYVRVSTTVQVAHQTIEQQLERVGQRLAQRGATLAAAVVFRDDGYSGATLQRPGLDRLRDAVRDRALDTLVITTPDRLARNYVHQMVLLDEFERAGCRVEFLDQPQRADPHDQLVLQIRGAVAEYERTLIAERMRRGRLAKLRAGTLLPWIRPPYGYRLDPVHPRDPLGVRVDAAEAAIVATIFASYLEPGASLYRLAQLLRAQRVPSPTGRPWWGMGTLRGVLTNPAYTGQVFAGRVRYRPPRTRTSAIRTFKHPHPTAVPRPAEEWIAVAPIPPIVTAEQVAQVQAKLAQNRVWARRHNTTHPYLLRAMVSCGHCLLSCTARTAGPHLAYYVCRGKDKPVFSHRGAACPSRYIPVQPLEALVWEDLCAVLQQPESLRYALEHVRSGAWIPQDLLARHTTLQHARRTLAEQRDRLTDAYAHGVLGLEELRRRRQDLDQKDAALAQQAAVVAAQADRQQELAGLVTGMTAFCQRVAQGLEQATFDQRRQLVELLIDRVLVTDDQVEMRYVIPTTPDGPHVRFCHLRTAYLQPQAPALGPGLSRPGCL